MGPCVVLSFSASGDDEWERSLVALGCTVHAFTNARPAAQTNLGYTVHKYRHIKDLAHIASSLALNRIDVLRVDCAGCEWEAFAGASAEALDIVDQVVLNVNFSHSLWTRERWQRLWDAVFVRSGFAAHQARLSRNPDSTPAVASEAANNGTCSPELDCASARASYLQLNPDVARAGQDPRKHYEGSGKKERRMWPGHKCCGKSDTTGLTETTTTQRASLLLALVRPIRVPNIVHWVYALGTEAPFGLLEFSAFMSVVRNVKPERFFFWYRHQPAQTLYWQLAQSHCELRHVDELTSPGRGMHYASESDFYRAEALSVYGGFYFDSDVLVLRDVQWLRRHRFAMPRESYYGLTNAIIVAERNATFLSLWRPEMAREYKEKRPQNCWACHSVVLPRELSTRMPG